MFRASGTPQLRRRWPRGPRARPPPRRVGGASARRASRSSCAALRPRRACASRRSLGGGRPGKRPRGGPAADSSRGGPAADSSRGGPGLRAAAMVRIRKSSCARGRSARARSARPRRAGHTHRAGWTHTTVCRTHARGVPCTHETAHENANGSNGEHAQRSARTSSAPPTRHGCSALAPTPSSAPPAPHAQTSCTPAPAPEHFFVAVYINTATPALRASRRWRAGRSRRTRRSCPFPTVPHTRRTTVPLLTPPPTVPHTRPPTVPLLTPGAAAARRAGGKSARRLQ